MSAMTGAGVTEIGGGPRTRQVIIGHIPAGWVHMSVGDRMGSCVRMGTEHIGGSTGGLRIGGDKSCPRLAADETLAKEVRLDFCFVTLNLLLVLLTNAVLDRSAPRFTRAKMPAGRE
jgi:hypothetical protein